MFFSLSRRLKRSARSVFGWQRLHPEQLRAMQAVMRGRDTLVVMPTGAGKSAVYQVPGLLLKGPTVVVSPLIALQRDQIKGLLRRKDAAAAAVNSSQSTGQNEAVWDRIRAGNIDFLFLAPEQLSRDEVVGQLAAAAPALFVVDEAQCVSTWGHDFRPDYLRLASVIERVGRPPVLALTASASAPVRADIVAQLGMREVFETVTGFDRPNIHLEVLAFQDETAKHRAVLERVAAEPKPGLLYVATRRDADLYARELAELGLDAAAYHAGLAAAERSRVHDQFLGGDLDVVVATSAFGMGVDKPDVRFVVHASIPGSLDAYYQEIGRAGRDGHQARAVLAYRPQDLGMQRFFASGRPDADTVAAVARALHSHQAPVPASVLRKETGLTASRLTAVVNLLQQVRAVRTTNRGELEPLSELGPTEATEQALRLADAHQELERSRVDMMRGYAETTVCRRRFLLGYFGQASEDPCGSCDRCDQDLAGNGTAGAGHDRGLLDGTSTVAAAGTDTGTATDARPAAVAMTARHPFAPGIRVRHQRWGHGAVMSEEDGRLTVLFENVGYRTLSLAVVQEHDLLSAEPAPPRSRRRDH